MRRRDVVTGIGAAPAALAVVTGARAWSVASFPSKPIVPIMAWHADAGTGHRRHAMADAAGESLGPE